MNDSQQHPASDPSGHPSDEILEQGYKIRDEVWRSVGRLDDAVLAHLVNPGFMGMPSWPNLRQSYRIVHLDNGHTIIATDGLSDPFMADHAFYKPNVNGFGLELYIEITEPFDMAKAGYTWWYNLLYQESLQVAYSGNVAEMLDQYGGVLSTELYDIPGLSDDKKNEGRAPILIGTPSSIVPRAINGPLSPIRFVSIALLNLDELQVILEGGADGRQRIVQGFTQRYQTPVSALERPSVHLPEVAAAPQTVPMADATQSITPPTDTTPHAAEVSDIASPATSQTNSALQSPASPTPEVNMSILSIDASGLSGPERGLTPESVARLETLLGVTLPDLSEYWANTEEDVHSFYSLFFDVLLEHQICAIDLDWKWSPEDVFWQVQKLLPDHEIKLIKSRDNETYVAYDVDFSFDGEPEELTVGFGKPNDLIALMNSHLNDKHFIDIWFSEDRYGWLLVPRNMDMNAFQDITGLRLSDRPSPGQADDMELRAQPAAVKSPALPSSDDKATSGKIDVTVKQSWLEKSSDSALEEFKAVLVNALNSLPQDRYTEDRWGVTQTSEAGEAFLVYDKQPAGILKFEDNALRFTSHNAMPRYDDVMYSIRYAASRLILAVYSHLHGGTRLPQDQSLSIDSTYFRREKKIAKFFENSRFIPRFAREGVQDIGDGRQALVLFTPYYVESKDDGSIHVTNDAMLKFLLEKDDQRTNREFSYKVADSMQDFARKHDLGLIPSSFYQNYNRSVKIINETYFDIDRITRKVFIDPYVWDFDDEHDYRFYKNVKNGTHLMDKVRKGENLDTALKRVLHEELQVADDYVGARIVALDFDRDREGVLTPRLVVNVFVHGMHQKQRSQSHDWVSIK